MNEQQQLAIFAVQAAAEACRTDPAISAKGAYQECISSIAEAEKYLIDAIEGRIIGDSPNPAFKHFDMATAKLVLLSVEFSEVFDRLMANICLGQPLASYTGFVATFCFMRALSDDHDYVLSRDDSDSAVIEIVDGCLLGPASLHAYLSRLI
jgi:hypothetical protein